MSHAHAERTVGDSRTRLNEAAMRVFGRNGIDGTSLQMVADELGVTKSAIYWHYKTKDDLVIGVVTPMLDDIARAVEAAQVQRGRQAQVEVMIEGFAEVLVRQRRDYVPLAGDPGLDRLLSHHPMLARIGGQVFDLLVGPEADEARRVSVTLYLSGAAGVANSPSFVDSDDAFLRDQLVALGRVLLID